MIDSVFTVFMHPTLVDELDEGFSPMDGIVAIDQILGELPKLHPAPLPKRSRKQAGRRLKVFRGRYDWYRCLGFSYVQLGTELHVLELWFDKDGDNPNRQKVDVVLGVEFEEDYVPLESIPKA